MFWPPYRVQDFEFHWFLFVESNFLKEKNFQYSLLVNNQARRNIGGWFGFVQPSFGSGNAANYFNRCFPTQF